MSIWYEGSGEIACTPERAFQAAADVAAFHVGVVGHMPGIAGAEVIDQGADAITLRTNEGTLRRSSLATRREGDAVVVDYAEEAQARRLIVKTHFRHEFRPSAAGVTHRLTLSDVSASGLMGFLYRTFGARNIGRALLGATKAHLEEPSQ